MPLRTAYQEGIQPLEEPKQHTQPAKAPTQRINPEEVREIRGRQSTKMSISEMNRSIKLKETEMLLKELIEVTASPLGQRKK